MWDLVGVDISEEMYPVIEVLQKIPKGPVGKILTQRWGFLRKVGSGCSLPAFTHLVANSLEVYRLVLIKRRKVL